MPDVVRHVGKRCFAVRWRQVTRRGLSKRAAAARPGGGYRYERQVSPPRRRQAVGVRRPCGWDRECPGIASQPPSGPLARRRNACSPRIGGAYIRQYAGNICRNAVYTVTLHYPGTPMPFEGRGGAAEPGRLAGGAVTPAEPGAKRHSGRRRWRPRPTGATVRSGRRWCRREPGRLPGPACHVRPRRLSAGGGAAAGSRARGRGPSPAPVARSSAEHTVRQHAALPGRMPRVLA
jgi:hypothetical protein